MRELIIVEQEWLHREGAKRSYLLRTSDRKKCAIGFYLAACGMNPSSFENKFSVSQITASLPEECGWLRDAIDKDGMRFIASQDCIGIQDSNDNDDFMHVSKEDLQKQIIGLFDKHNVNVRFV